ncbi:MAG TPA: hypothetical protein VI585_00135 [Candidatus Binatia bacterium]
MIETLIALQQEQLKLTKKNGPQRTSQVLRAKARKRIFADVDKLADGKPHTRREMVRLFGTGTTFLSVIPWLEITWDDDGKVTFTVDRELREICENRSPRPLLSGLSIREFLHKLRQEISRRRKANHDQCRKRNWNSDLILKREQTLLLDWIEEELNTLR